MSRFLDALTPISVNNALGRNSWPPASEASVWAEVELLSALRSSDDTRLRMEAGVAWNYPYLITPVPRMISRASANMLYGEPPEISTENDSDQARYDFIVDENGLTAELVRGALMSSSEGDVWGRVIVRPDILDCPIIDFSSRRNVIPEFSGRFLTAATFVHEWTEGYTEVFRLFERHSAGAVDHVLYKGTSVSLGDKINLNAYGRTQGMPERVLTGIPTPLVQFIPNSVDSDPTRGYSDYRGLEQRFLSLNAAETVGHNNVLLTGQKRAMIDSAYTQNGGVPKGDTFLIRRADDAMAGDSKSKGIDVLEYTFEATELVAWVDHIVDISLTAAGIAPQLVGRSVDGGAISGTALKLKAAHSLLEASGKGRHFDRGLKKLLRYAAIIDSRRTTEGGFGRKWSAPDELVTIERADPMPRDDMEAAQILVLLTNAEAVSTEEKVRLVHPEWDEDQVQEEVQKLGAAGPGVTEPAPAPGGNAAVPARPALTLPAGGPTPGAPNA